MFLHWYNHNADHDLSPSLYNSTKLVVFLIIVVCHSLSCFCFPSRIILLLAIWLGAHNLHGFIMRVGLMAFGLIVFRLTHLGNTFFMIALNLYWPNFFLKKYCHSRAGPCNEFRWKLNVIFLISKFFLSFMRIMMLLSFSIMPTYIHIYLNFGNLEQGLYSCSYITWRLFRIKICRKNTDSLHAFRNLKE